MSAPPEDASDSGATASPEAPTHAAAPRPGWRGVLLRLLVVAALVGLDLWSKSVVFAWLPDTHRTGSIHTSAVAIGPFELPGEVELVNDCHALHRRIPLVGNWLAFYLSWNPGMAWGITALPPWVLVGGRVAAVLFLGWLLLRVPGRRWVLVTALVLILAGALGNLHDNLLLEPRAEGARFGEVRDFIDVYFAFREWHFPTFNVADSCITVGAVLLLLSGFGSRPDADGQPDSRGRRRRRGSRAAARRRPDPTPPDAGRGCRGRRGAAQPRCRTAWARLDCPAWRTSRWRFGGSRAPESRSCPRPGPSGTVWRCSTSSPPETLRRRAGQQDGHAPSRAPGNPHAAHRARPRPGSSTRSGSRTAASTPTCETTLPE